MIVYCVNDGAVMDAWAESQGVDQQNGLIKLFADPKSELTMALDISLTHPGPQSVGLINRSKRTAMYLEDGVVKIFKISERPDDPAGDEHPEDTCVESMLESIAEFKKQNAKDEL